MFIKTLVGLLGVIVDNTELDLEESQVVGVDDDLHINDVSGLVGGGDDLVTKLASSLVKPGCFVRDGVSAHPALPLVPVPEHVVSSAKYLIVCEVHRVVIAVSIKIFQKYLVPSSPPLPPHLHMEFRDGGWLRYPWLLTWPARARPRQTNPSMPDGL